MWATSFGRSSGERDRDRCPGLRSASPIGGPAGPNGSNLDVNQVSERQRHLSQLYFL